MSGKVAIAGLYHETNTFSVKPTTIQDFKDYQFALGNDILERYRGTNTEMGGMITAAAQTDLELAPLLFAAAVPSGTITRDCYDHLCADIEDLLRQAEPIDGLLLVLHGAAVADGAEDADGYLLSRMRQMLGDERPIVATTDYHANISRLMFGTADVIVGYDSFPHVDMSERGEEAVRLLCSLMQGERMVGAFHSIPLATVPQRQASADQPMARIMERLHALEVNDGIHSGTLAMGFPYADTADIGSAVLFYGSERKQAQQAADEVAVLLWSHRTDFAPNLTPVEALSEYVGETTGGPTVLVDPADNVGGGSAGDGTAVLGELLRQNIPGAVVVLNDPAAAAQAGLAGTGGAFAGYVGAKVDKAHGDPVFIEGTVRFCGEASFTHSGSYMTGFVTSMGYCAVVATCGSHVVLTSLRTMPFDIEQLRAVGLEPTEQRIIVVKSATAWRAAYGPIAGETVFLDTPGICPSNLSRLPYRKRRRPLFPLEADASFTTRCG